MMSSSSFELQLPVSWVHRVRPEAGAEASSFFDFTAGALAATPALCAVVLLLVALVCACRHRVVAPHLARQAARASPAGVISSTPRIRLKEEVAVELARGFSANGAGDSRAGGKVRSSRRNPQAPLRAERTRIEPQLPFHSRRSSGIEGASLIAGQSLPGSTNASEKSEVPPYHPNPPRRVTLNLVDGTGSDAQLEVVPTRPAIPPAEV